MNNWACWTENTQTLYNWGSLWKQETIVVLLSIILLLLLLSLLLLIYNNQYSFSKCHQKESYLQFSRIEKLDKELHVFVSLQILMKVLKNIVCKIIPKEIRNLVIKTW